MTKRKRVAFFSICFPIYREAVLETLSNHPDIDFEFASGLVPPGSMMREASAPGIKRIFIRVLNLHIPGTKYALTWLEGALSSVVFRKYDALVLTNDVLAPYVWMACLLGPVFRVPICIWGQGISRPPSAFRDTLRRWLTRLATSAVYYSEGGRQYWIDRGIQREKLFVAYNALDSTLQIRVRDTTTPEHLNEFLACEQLENKKTIVCLGRLIALKRPDILVAAVAKLAANDPDVLGIFLGDGPERAALEHQAKELGALAQIRFVGETYDEKFISKYLMTCKAVLLPAAAGLAIQHAAVYGAPLVLGDQPGHHLPEQEIVKHEETGLWCPDSDVEAFAKALSRFIYDDGFRNKVSINLKQEIDEKYNTRKMAQGFVDAVQYCLASKASNAPRTARQE